MRKELKPNVTVKKGRNGSEYHYYRLSVTAGGERKEKYIRIKAEPGTPDYDRIYWEIRSGKYDAKPSRTTFSALVPIYLQSKYFRRLADGTKRKYRPILDQIREKNGTLDVTRVSRGQVEAIHEKYAATPRKADWYVQILSILFKHAIRLEWITHNPASGVELFGAQREFKPWPVWFQDAYLAKADGIAETIFYLGAGTGQRPGDVVKMEWSHFDGEYMSVIQDKTKERMKIYCPLVLREYLERLPKQGKYLFAKNLTQRLSYDAAERRFRAVRSMIAETRPEAKDYTLHGLRYLAALELAEAGCSDAEIQAVTGHRTLTMVQKYRNGAQQKLLSKRAQTRREQNRKKT